jgi:hypothetical protein
VSAQGVRIMKSKLRQSIQDLSYSKIALVRGKEYWRLTSAEKLISLYDKRVHLHVRKVIAQSLQFVKRLTAGETKHEELFDMLSKLFTFCFENSKQLVGHADEKVIDALKLVSNFRILESLGYGSDKNEFNDIRGMFDWNIIMLERLAKKKKKMKEMESHIKHAIVSSHL